jgi:leucyl-tRNA synthetase
MINNNSFDYYIPAKKLAIDITSNKIMRKRVQGFHEAREKADDDTKAIFISEIEVFEKIRLGKDSFRSWLQQLIEEGSDYHSPVSEKDSFFVSHGFIARLDLEGVDVLHVDVSLVDGTELDIARFRDWRAEYREAEFILEDGRYICGVEVEKMSKSKYNTVNPDELCDRYGADTFRMYEMFLGPVEASKPWDTKGIEGVHRFLKKLWRLFYNDSGLSLSDEKASPEELKVLHKAIKKIEHDTANFSFNTAVSAFMVCVNELTDLQCNKKEILEPLLILLAPYAPHIT